jgi:hypothetical protein
MANRRVSIGAGLLLLCSVAALAYAAGQVKAAKALTKHTVRAQRFELVDAAGKVRSVLGVSDDGGSGLGLWDRDGKDRGGLMLLADGTPGLALRDREGKQRILLTFAQRSDVARTSFFRRFLAFR